MLQNIRDNAQGTVAKVIIFLVVISFALFGLESIVGGAGEPEVASVNGEGIKEYEFLRAVDQQRRRVLAQMGEAADPSLIDDELLRRSVLDGLIEEKIQLGAADDKDLVVSDALINQYIRSLPAFQQDGQFDQDVYAGTLRNMGMTSNDFRNLIRRDLLIQQHREAYQQTAFTTNSELDLLLRLDRQARDFSYVEIPADRFAAEVSVTEDEVQAYYQTNQERFQLPERLAVRYLELRRQELANEVTVSEEDLRKRYEQEMARTELQEERNAAHILIEIGDQTSEAQAKEQIDAIRRQLADGADFADLATKHSDDPGSVQAGGDLGYVTKGIFVPEFDAALFAMTPGEISEPVKTEYGYHILKLQGVRTQEQPPFEEMRDQLVISVREEQAERLYLEKIEKLADISYAAPDLEEPARELGLEIKESPVFSRDAGDGIFADPRVVRSAFSRDVLAGNNSELIELGRDRAVVLRVQQHFQSEVQPLAAVEDSIRETLRRQKSLELAANFGQKLLTEHRDGAALQDLANAADLQLEAVQGATRGQPSVRADILRHAFRMPRPRAADEQAAPVASIEGVKLGHAFYVISLQQVKDGSVGDYAEAELQTIRNLVADNQGAREYSLVHESHRQDAKIVRN
jgi:peptidyl-prolyl cis-trans isomerase D